MSLPTSNLDTTRRFSLGNQGLWPRRRWRGLQGTEQAVAAMEYLQLDPRTSRSRQRPRPGESSL